MIRATARRDDRGEPVKPIATSFSCALSARIVFSESWTHSSILAGTRRSSAAAAPAGRPRRRPARRPPGPRCGASSPRASRPPDTNRSNRTRQECASIPRQTSSGPSWGLAPAHQHRQADPRSDPNRGTRPRSGPGVSDQQPTKQLGNFVATTGQKPWPPVGTFVAAHGQFFTAVVRPVPAAVGILPH